jgi:imidazolonepropionase-like amidohydrolase
MAKATRLLIKNGTLIDGSGGDPVPNRLLVVEGNRITVVGEPDGSMWPETPDDTVFEATGKFILPGLIDAHCHISLHQGALPGMKYTSTAEFCTLWAVHAIGRVLRAGVTSIAVPGGKWFTDVTVREAVEGGLIEGPRMVVAIRTRLLKALRPIRPASCAIRATSSFARPANNASGELI